MKMHDLIWYQTVEVAHIIVLRFSLIKSFIHNLHYNNYYHFLTQFHCLKCLNQMKNFLENAGIQPWNSNSSKLAHFQSQTVISAKSGMSQKINHKFYIQKKKVQELLDTSVSQSWICDCTTL